MPVSTVMKAYLLGKQGLRLGLLVLDTLGVRETLLDFGQVADELGSLVDILFLKHGRSILRQWFLHDGTG